MQIDDSTKKKTAHWIISLAQWCHVTWGRPTENGDPPSHQRETMGNFISDLSILDNA